MGKDCEFMDGFKKEVSKADPKPKRKKKGADAGVVERARLENEKSIRLVGSNPTLPGENERWWQSG